MKDEEEDEYLEQDESEALEDARINAISLAIKAAGLSETPKEPEQILKIARDFYNFIMNGDD